MEQQQMTTTQRLALFETAQETIGMMVAHCSRLIGTERSKAHPDLAVISKLKADADAYEDELDALFMDDDQGIRAALDKYGPIVKARMTETPAADAVEEKMVA